VTLAAISFDLRQALSLGLRVADRLGEHLAQLSLGLWWLARKGFLPLGHGQYVGMPEGELNPYGRLALALKLRNTRHGSFSSNILSQQSEPMTACEFAKDFAGRASVYRALLSAT